MKRLNLTLIFSSMLLTGMLAANAQDGRIDLASGQGTDSDWYERSWIHSHISLGLSPSHHSHS